MLFVPCASALVKPQYMYHHAAVAPVCYSERSMLGGWECRNRVWLHCCHGNRVITLWTTSTSHCVEMRNSPISAYMCRQHAVMCAYLLNMTNIQQCMVSGRVCATVHACHAWLAITKYRAERLYMDKPTLNGFPCTSYVQPSNSLG